METTVLHSSHVQSSAVVRRSSRPPLPLSERPNTGVVNSNLVIGIDFTKSNTWTGQDTFGGQSLHDCSNRNPYQQVLDVIGRTLTPFDDDNLIPTFGFGDLATSDRSCFPFFPDRRPCQDFEEVLARYNEITPLIQMSGPLLKVQQ
jgi:E3 ubiquitin-protein ligase RGLG